MVYVLKLVLFGLLSIPFSFFMLIGGVVDRRGKIAYRFARSWCDGVLFLGGIRIKVSGADQLDTNQAYVFMANHQSNLDIPALIAALPRFQLRWIAKRELLRIPVFGWGFWGCRMITINRDSLRDAKSSMREACQKLGDGLSIVVFPEGTRSLDGELLAFKRGGFVLAQNARAPIVPITIQSCEVEIIIGKVISRDEAAGDSRTLTTKVRQIIGSHLGSGDNEMTRCSGLAGSAG
jgi:1-acyl-sn-glycerol-3-phosphate acyltransferase